MKKDNYVVFETKNDYLSEMKDIRKRYKLHTMVEERLINLLEELYPENTTIAEVYGVTNGRADIVMFSIKGLVHFEIFASKGTVLRDINLLNQSIAELKIIIILDEDIDKSVKEEYFRRVRYDSFPLINLSKVMIQEYESQFKEEIVKLVNQTLVMPETDIKTLLNTSRMQVEKEIAIIGDKYLRKAYISREAVIDVFKQFLLQGEKNSFVILGEAGIGKTSLFCYLAETFSKEVPLVLLRGTIKITEAYHFEKYISDTFNVLTGRNLNFSEWMNEIEKIVTYIGIDFIVFIDAINESKDFDSMRDTIARLLTYSKGKRIKFCISCRDSDWRFFCNLDVLKNNLYTIESLGGTESDNLHMKVFNNSEFYDAWEEYSEMYGIRGSINGDAREKCKHPLILRLFCEAFGSKHSEEIVNIGYVDNIEWIDIFDRYWKRKIDIPEEEKLSKKQLLFCILEKMYNFGIEEVNEYELFKDIDLPLYEDSFNKLISENVITFAGEIQNDLSEVINITFVYEAFHEYALSRWIFETENWPSLDADDMLDRFKKILKITDYRPLRGALLYLILTVEEVDGPYIEMLKSLLSSDNTTEICYAISITCRVKDTLKVEKLLLNIVENDDDVVRKHLVRQIFQHSNRFEIEFIQDIIENIIEDEDMTIRIEVAKAFGINFASIENNIAINLLTKLCGDAYPIVRRIASSIILNHFIDISKEIREQCIIDLFENSGLEEKHVNILWNEEVTDFIPYYTVGKSGEGDYELVKIIIKILVHHSNSISDKIIESMLPILLRTRGFDDLINDVFNQYLTTMSNTTYTIFENAFKDIHTITNL